MHSECTDRRPGRPRCEETRNRILESAIEELATCGWENFTIEHVAARSKVSKVTIYRWWASKAHLILDAYIKFGICPLTAEVSGDLRADFRAIVEITVDVFSGHKSAAAKAVVAAMQSDPELACRFQEFWCPATENAVKRAIEAANIPAPAHLPMLRDLLIGPICLKCLITGDQPTDEYIDELVDLILDRLQVLTPA
ncbi:TetR/AcrR family transcriptional regulator [Kamptonema cortianum]|nr:TetR/AcrR family transcriptional regulator [Kamptonema cortianum]